jgi:DNA (cytosine-5)-methyltransferase 1
MTPLPTLDIFSGIGGFSLGLELSGACTPVAFCEIDPYCRRVLAKHWPKVPCYDDIRSLSAKRLRADGVVPRAICGGFPCQDISVAGAGAGIEGERSGLWTEYARLVDEIRPDLAVVENVSALLGRGLDRVLGDLAALGYDAEWHCIPASAVGAPHRRDRLWVIAYPARAGRGEVSAIRQFAGGSGPERDGASRRLGDVAHADCLVGDEGRPNYPEEGSGGRHAHRSGIGADVADAGRARLPLPEQARWAVEIEAARDQWGPTSECGWWATEPDVGRVANGVPARVDRLRSLGNAVVPQIPEIIGRVILGRLQQQAAA